MNTSHAEFQLEELKNQALALMEQEGYQIQSAVSTRLDPDLPFMGYTTQEKSLPVIVVSNKSLKGGMALSLLVHELCHVYRTQEEHPSHNYRLLSDIVTFVMRGKIVEPYQEEIVQGIVNHLQDLYADDISFKVFAKLQNQPNLNEFFLTWVHEPSKDKDHAKKAWNNAAAVVSAAFAQANLERHAIPDTDKKVNNTITSFLNQLPQQYTDKYEFFKKFMILLPEEVNDKNFEKLLITYLSEFSKLLK